MGDESIKLPSRDEMFSHVCDKFYIIDFVDPDIAAIFIDVVIGWTIASIQGHRKITQCEKAFSAILECVYTYTIHGEELLNKVQREEVFESAKIRFNDAWGKAEDYVNESIQYLYRLSDDDQDRVIMHSLLVIDDELLSLERFPNTLKQNLIRHAVSLAVEIEAHADEDRPIANIPGRPHDPIQAEKNMLNYVIDDIAYWAERQNS